MSMFDLFIEKLKLEVDPDEISQEEFVGRFNEFIDASANILIGSFYDNTEKHIRSKEIEDNIFLENHKKIWRAGLEKLEILIEVCIDAGSNFNKNRKRSESDAEDFLLEILVRLHAKSCAIANEILYLLKGGFADASQARWRALHETNVTLAFISKHGLTCAQRFIEHEVVDSYNGMKIHKKYEHKMQAKGPSIEEVEILTLNYKEVIKKYGKGFEKQYGWLEPFFPGINNPGFQSMEKDVGLDHMRIYFKWASQNIHTSFKTLTKTLTLPEFDPSIINVGPSNYGLVDPAHSTALSLAQATCFILARDSEVESVVLMKALTFLTDEVGITFLDTANKLNDY